MAADIDFQRFNVAQNDKMPLPGTLASAATIAPLGRFTFITGTVQVATITPPLTGYHELLLCFTNAAPGLFLTSGNIQIAYQPVQNRPILLCYDPATAKYWAGAVV